MSGLWRSDAPRKGWACQGVEDLGAPEGRCEMCGREEIRYVHYMVHPRYHGTISAGCVCAEKMADDYSTKDRPSAAKRRETVLKNAFARRCRWPTLLAWKTSRNGNPHIKKGGFHIIVFRKSGQHKFSIDHAQLRARYFAPRSYDDELSAKLAAFDAMNYLMEQGLA
jgi:hypothetical protein